MTLIGDLENLTAGREPVYACVEYYFDTLITIPFVDFAKRCQYDCHGV